MYRFRIVLLILFLLPAVIAKGAPTVRHYTTAEGLPSTFVKHINQLPSGYLVISTDDGLVFYDGYDFTTLTRVHGLPDNVIKQTLIDDQNRLIIATDKGLAISNPDPAGIPDTFSIPSFHHSVEDQRIRALYQSTSGTIFLAGQSEVFRLDDPDSLRSIPFAFNPSTQNNFVRSYDFEEDDKGGIIITSAGDNLLYIPPDEQQVLQIPDTEMPNQLRVIIHKSDNRYWIGSDSGLYLMEWNSDQQRINKIDLVENSQNLEIDALTLLSNRELLVGSNGQGLFRLNEQYNRLVPIHEFFSNFIKHIFQDRNKNRWISTDHGVVLLPQTPFQNISREEGIPRRSITAVIKDRTDNVWVGTMDGLYRRKSDSRVFNKIDYLDRTLIKSINYKEGKNAIFAITSSDIHRITLADAEGELLVTLPQGVDITTSVVTDTEMFWMVDYSGSLHRYDHTTGNVTSYGPDQGVTADIHAITQTSDDRIWISGKSRYLGWYDAEVDSFRHISWENFPVKPSPDAQLNYLHPGNTHYLWFSDIDRIFYINPIDENHSGTVSGSVDIGSLNWLYTSGNQLWAGSNRLLHLFHKNDTGDITGFRNFSTASGLTSTSFSYGAVFGDHYGNIWMGTNVGVSYFTGGDIVTRTSPIRLRHWSAGNEIFTNTHKRVLNYDTRQLNFSFTTFDFPSDDVVYQSRIRFAGDIRAPDEGWSLPTTSNDFTQFIHGSGRYIFEVRASRNSSDWSAPILIHFVIPRPWWFGNTMLLIYFVLFLSAIACFVTWRSGKLRKLNRKLAHVIRERTDHLTKTVQKLEDEIESRTKVENELQESNSTKERLIKVLSHDLRSPFQGIIGFASMLRDNYEEFPDEERKEMIGQVIQSTQKAISLLDNMLYWIRLQSGQMTFDPTSVSPAEVLDDVTELLQSLANSKKISILSNVDRALIVHADRNMLQSILQNLMSNAIKFTGNGGKVSISAVVKREMVEFQVTDNGIGMKQETLDKILNTEQSRSTQGTGNERGSGVGLLICKEMVEYHEGTLAGTSSPGIGSTFRFTLPKGSLPEGKAKET